MLVTQEKLIKEFASLLCLIPPKFLLALRSSRPPLPDRQERDGQSGERRKHLEEVAHVAGTSKAQARLEALTPNYPNRWWPSCPTSAAAATAPSTPFRRPRAATTPEHPRRPSRRGRSHPRAIRKLSARR